MKARITAAWAALRGRPVALNLNIRGSLELDENTIGAVVRNTVIRGV